MGFQHNLRPDIFLSTADNTLYIIELTAGFETNLDKNRVANWYINIPDFTNLVYIFGAWYVEFSFGINSKIWYILVYFVASNL